MFYRGPEETRRSLDGYVVGAYAASPAHRTWHPQLEAEFLQGLALDGRIAALELPWMGRLHPHDEQWLFQHLPPRLSMVLTDIPHVMTVLPDDNTFGLASADAKGRQRAIDQVARVRDDVRRLNDVSGRSTVAVVELHSAPRRHGTDIEFAKSLETVANWDWDGAELVVEHCDAWVVDQPAEKGFLSLESEIRAIAMSGVDIGISINWGRSAIELRDPDRVSEHLQMARSAGLLAGFMVSGAADSSSDFGAAWIDAHHPFQRSEQHPYGAAESLLTTERLLASLTSAGLAPWMGVKVGWPPLIEGTVSQRIEMITAALDSLDEAREFTRHRIGDSGA